MKMTKEARLGRSNNAIDKAILTDDNDDDDNIINYSNYYCRRRKFIYCIYILKVMTINKLRHKIHLT